jgi:hypothetical protein
MSEIWSSLNKPALIAQQESFIADHASLIDQEKGIVADEASSFVGQESVWTHRALDASHAAPMTVKSQPLASPAGGRGRRAPRGG